MIPTRRRLYKPTVPGLRGARLRPLLIASSLAGESRRGEPHRQPPIRWFSAL